MLTKKTFLTEDANGCEFKVVAEYFDNVRKVNGKYEHRSARYEAMGIVADSLEELKKRVSEL